MSETADILTRDTSLPAVQADFRAIFEASPNPMLLIAADPPRFTMLAVNQAHATAFRTTPEALIGRGVLEVFAASPEPEADRFIEVIRQSFARTLATRRPDQLPVLPSVGIDPEGRREERYWSAVQTPLFGPDGEIAQILSTVREVTAEVKERQATEARALLMREIDHRARNALAVVQSVVRLTQADDVAAFKTVVLGRVEALARAQGSLARRKWEGAHLADVVEAELAALGFGGACSVVGPAILLPAEKVQAMSMVLHELATNAAKYGALSVASGTISVTWREAPPGRLALTWCEAGGPMVQPPQRRGFGSRLIHQLADQLGGEVRKDWRPEGLHVELTAAL